MKYIVATISFLFVWVCIIISYVCIYDLIILLLFPMQGSILFIGFGWQSFPGWILGIWAGVHSWKVSLLKADKNKIKRQTWRINLSRLDLRPVPPFSLAIVSVAD